MISQVLSALEFYNPPVYISDFPSLSFKEPP